MGTRKAAPFLSPKPRPHAVACAAAAKAAGATAGGASTRSDGAGSAEWKRLGGCLAFGISAGGGAGTPAHRRARDAEGRFVRSHEMLPIQVLDSR